MAKSNREREAARAARQALKAQFAAAGKGRPSDKQLDKAATKAINQVNKASSGSNKQATQQFISGIISDGRVTQQEAQKAASTGVSLARIQKAQTKSFQPGNVFSRSTTPPGAPGRLTSTQSAQAIARGAKTAQPAYSPLVIQGAAQKVFNNATAPAPAPAPAAAPVTAAPLAPPAPPPVDPMLEALLAQNELIQQQLAATPDFESIFAQQAQQAAQQRADDLAQMQQQQALAMEEMAARQAEQERQRLITSQTQQANMARAGLMPDFSIGGRRSDMYGTGGFKRRGRIRPATIAQGIAPTTPTAGATNGNLLNV